MFYIHADTAITLRTLREGFSERYANCIAKDSIAEATAIVAATVLDSCSNRPGIVTVSYVSS